MAAEVNPYGQQKTGALIAERRRALGLTQDQLAERLHVTGKAVSNWERGLRFPDVALLSPLAEALGVNVTDLLAGEVILPAEASPAREAKTDAVVIDTLTAAERTRRRARLVIDLTGMLVVVFVLLNFFVSYAPSLFQRGNPLPYLAAAAQLSDERTFVAVDGEPGVYIAHAGECPALFAMIEAQWDVSLIEQAGSGYIFANDHIRIVASSEIYLGRWTVWQLPSHTMQSMH